MARRETPAQAGAAPPCPAGTARGSAAAPQTQLPPAPKSDPHTRRGSGRAQPSPTSSCGLPARRCGVCGAEGGYILRRGGRQGRPRSHPPAGSLKAEGWRRRSRLSTEPGGGEGKRGKSDPSAASFPKAFPRLRLLAPTRRQRRSRVGAAPQPPGGQTRRRASPGASAAARARRSTSAARGSGAAVRGCPGAGLGARGGGRAAPP